MDGDCDMCYSTHLATFLKKKRGACTIYIAFCIFISQIIKKVNDYVNNIKPLKVRQETLKTENPDSGKFHYWGFLGLLYGKDV